NALVRKAESLRATIESLTRSLDDEIAKRKLADELAAQISADARDDRRFAKAKADTLNKVRYHLAPNLAVFVAGINEPSCRTLHGCLQKFLKPLCDAQVRFVYGPNGRGFRSVAKKLGGLDYEALYKFAEVRSLNPEDPSYKNLRRQLESIINSGDFIRWAEVFGCDSVTASNAEWVAKNIIQIN
ncbi:MAG: hypothetical protein JW699_06345, partial [Chitinispirillaceae bacterium]|nr:hypothetical protein [Chitinispirillaceae bacterium]